MPSQQHSSQDEDPAHFIKERRTAKDFWTMFSYGLLILAIVLQVVCVLVFDLF